MGSRRGSSAERIGEELLRVRGFDIEASHHVVSEGDGKIAEIDFLATRDGTRYAVEVKAGSGDVQAIRQAYANAHLVDREPVLICKTLAAEARLAADRLGVAVLEVATFYPLVEPEELEIIVRGALEETFERFGFLRAPDSVHDEDREALAVLSEARTPKDAAEALGHTVDTWGQVLGRLKNRHLLPNRSLPFTDVAKAAASVLAQVRANDRLRHVEQSLSRIEGKLDMLLAERGLDAEGPEKDPTSMEMPHP